MDGSEDFSAFVVVVGIAFESASLFSSLSRCPKGCVSFRGKILSLALRICSQSHCWSTLSRFVVLYNVQQTFARSFLFGLMIEFEADIIEAQKSFR